MSLKVKLSLASTLIVLLDRRKTAARKWRVESEGFTIAITTTLPGEIRCLLKLESVSREYPLENVVHSELLDFRSFRKKGVA